MRRNRRAAPNTAASKPILALVLIFIFSAAGFSQRDVSAEYAAAGLPDPVMKEVVNRILVWSFKPRNRPALIYLSGEEIKEEWLPSIRNVNFKLLVEDEVRAMAGKGVYFFQRATLKKKTKTYEMGFGFGDPRCESDGTGWYFRVSKNKIRMWVRPGWGFGCGHA